MASIQMTPQDLRDSADFLNGKKDEIISAVGQIQSRVNSTTAEWSGASQSTFIANFEEMLPMLQKDFPQAIEGIAAQLKGAADAIEGADEEVAKAFQG